MQKIKSAFRVAVTVFAIAFWFPSKAQQLIPGAYSPDIPLSYVRTWDAVKPDSTNANFHTGTHVLVAKMTTLYVDGLGRPLQTVVKQGAMATGDSARDLVSPVIYDPFSREQYKYLPFMASYTGVNRSVRDGFFKLNPFTQDSVFSKTQYPDETWYYNQANFEASPLSRSLETFAPGNNWVGTSGQSAEADRHSVKAKYWINTALDSVRRWTVTDVNNSFGSYTTDNFYEAGQLYKNIVVDEHGKQVVEFKDKTGLVVLKRVQLTGTADGGAGKGYHGWLSTIYIYDSLDQLRCVVQPRGVELLLANSWNIASLSNAILDEQCFRYEYDLQGRMTRKKVPGAGVVWMVYDARDRLVLTQDSIMRANHQWFYTQYDIFNRQLTTGIITDENKYNDLTYHQLRADTSIAYPKLSDYANDELTRTFYDAYDWLTNYSTGLSNTIDNSTNGTGNSNLLTASNTNWPYPQAVVQTAHLRGIVTGTRIKVLGSSDYLYSVNFYDDKGRAVQMKSKNITGGADISTMQYSWAGQPLITIQKQEKGGTNAQTIVAVTGLIYDSLFRVSRIDKKVSHSQVNGGAAPGNFTTIVENKYDKLGQISEKKLAPSFNLESGLEILSYDYNIRGSVLGINRNYVKDVTARYFGFELGYDKPSAIVAGTSYVNVQYNGNISGTIWKSKGDSEKRKYDFTYDAANRVLTADFNQYTSSAFNKNALIDFSLSNMAYDANGNIVAMKHRGLKLTSSVTIDSLAYNYIANSNKLLNVIDGLNDAQTKLGDFRTSTLHPGSGSKTSSTTDYTYDGNGNMVKDLNKDIVTYTGANGIVYNHLNLPQLITVRKASTDKGTIEYTYDAAGNKLKKTTTETGLVTTVTLYLGGTVFRNDTLEFIGHEEGRIRRSDTLVYDYMLKDHLGNVRMLLTTQQRTDMYPAATMETDSATKEEKYYSNLSSTRTDAPAGYGGGTPQKAAKVRATAGSQKIGPGITLKVMAGDKFHLNVNSWWTGSSPNSPVNPLTDLISAMAGNIGGITVGEGKATAIELQNGNILNDAASDFLATQSAYTTSKPKAFINWVLLDEQFKFVDASSGFEQVGTSGSYTSHIHTNLAVNKNGYLYIYVSNAENIDVFFDNLQITHVRGPMLEETHYYPFGLTMNGISSKSLAFDSPANKRKFNDGTELNTDMGLNWYETTHRGYDAQIGKFHQIDPLLETAPDRSPYSYVQNNPLLFNDPFGLDTIRANGKGHHAIEIKQGDVLAWTIGEVTSYYSYDPDNPDAVNGFVGGGIDQGSLPEVTVTGVKKSSGINANGLWMLWGAREYYSYKAAGLKGRFTGPNGAIDYAGGSAARTELKTFLRNRATPYPIRTFLDNNYPIVNKYNSVTKPTPRFWHTNPSVTWSMRGVGVATFTWDLAGLYNYYNNPNAINVVNPTDFALNTGTTGVMTFGGTTGFGVGFYFTLGRQIHNNFQNFTPEQKRDVYRLSSPGGYVPAFGPNGETRSTLETQ